MIDQSFLRAITDFEPRIWGQFKHLVSNCHHGVAAEFGKLALVATFRATCANAASWVSLGREMKQPITSAISPQSLKARATFVTNNVGDLIGDCKMVSHL